MTQSVYMTNLMGTGMPGAQAQLLANPMTTVMQPGEFFVESAADNIVACAGGGQTNATKLVNEMSRVTTVATAGDSVALPLSAPGMSMLVMNAGANAMQVFGDLVGRGTINGAPSNVGVSQSAGSIVIYACFSKGAWFVAGSL